MSKDTTIQWTDATWNPIRGCSKVSPGCTNCYAESVAARFSGPGLAYEGLTRAGRWNGRVVTVPAHFADPLRWTKPRRVFVNSMSDLFHESLPNETIAAVFGIMAASPSHTFQVLTKRAKRMHEFFAWIASPKASTLCFEAADRALIDFGHSLLKPLRWKLSANVQQEWPLPNVWLGVSVENQETADERIPLLIGTPAAVRFVSYEPALGAVDFARFLWPTCWHWDGRFQTPEAALAAGARAERKPQILVHAARKFVDWIIVGGESGAHAREFDVGFARSVVKQSKESGAAVFVKQLGARPVLFGGENARRPWPTGTVFGEPDEHTRQTIALRDGHGGDATEWPEDLRVREFPKAST